MYRIEAMLGRGGMGVVYRADDTRLGRKVALKLLPPELSEDPEFRARLEKESRVAASIDHPGVIPVYEAGETDGRLFIAMRYVEGTDLGQLLRAEGPLDPERALDLVGQLADALDAAHARGLVHRDVKPSNALVARAGAGEHLYLSDFGLSKHVNGNSTVTAASGFVGTVRYAAPEMIRTGDASPRSDLYSLGCVLLECLTGQPPFPGPSEPAVMYGHLEQPPPRLADRRPGLPQELDAVLARVLDKDPAQRWASGAEFMQAARAALAGHAPSRPVRPVRPVRHGRRPRAAVAGVAAVGLVAAAAAVWLGASDSPPELAAVKANGVAIIDPEQAGVDRQVALEGAPTAMAVGGGAVWVTDRDRGVVSRIDTETRTIRQTIDVGHGPAAIAVEPRGVWVANVQDGTISVISPKTNAVVDTTRIGRTVDGLCIGSGSVWVASPLDYAVVRIDPETGRQVSRVPLDTPPGRLACGSDAVWVSSAAAGTVTEISVGAGAPVRTIQVGRGVSGLALARSGLWASNPASGTVSRIDPGRGAVTATVALGASDAPRELAVTDEAVWVSSELGGTVARIDPAGARLVERLDVGNRPQGLAVVDGSLWVGVADTGARHRGGTLNLDYALKATWRDLDPATGGSTLSAELLSPVHDGLLDYSLGGGLGEAVLVPDLAEAVPPPTDGGRTYAFRLRPGLRYSNGEPVVAGDIRFSLERAVRQGSGIGLEAVRGVRDCTPKRCDLSEGVVTDDRARTVVFRLQAPDRDFLYKVGIAVLPQSVGLSAPTSKPLPATGPYVVKAFVAGRSLRLVRNPNFTPRARSAPDGYPDEIRVRFGVDGATAVGAVLQDKTDRVPSEIIPPEQIAALRRRAPEQLRSTVQPLTFYFVLNTKVAPFNRVEARQAVAYAFDRRAAVRAAGGSEAAQETCQILPPGFPGHRPYCPFTIEGSGGATGRPDLARARKLVRASRTRGMRVTVRVPDILPPDLGRQMAQTLRRLGYDATMKAAPPDEHFPALNDTGTRTQIGLLPWSAAYPSPTDFLANFSCRAIARDDPGNLNPSQFCDREVDRLMDEAARLQATVPATADELWARAEQRIVDAVPAVAAYNAITTELVSERLGNYRYSPFGGMVIDQAWVR